MSFIDLGLSSGICRNLAALGWTEPTPVQAASIPQALAGTDLVVGAQTGTGKTAAFALPILERMLRAGKPQVAAPKKPIALVLTPTRELACQVHESFRDYGAGLGLRGTVVFGGSDMGRQILALRRGAHVLVATPGRLIDHLLQKKVQLSSVEYLVLDEADRMLDMGFLPALEKILEALPKKRQTWLFSATLEPEITGIASRFMTDPARIQISSANSVASTIRHRFHPVEHSKKRDMLVHLLAEDVNRQTLVFCRTKMGCDRLTEYLDTGGFRVDTIHGDKSQAARLAALRKFKEGRANVLVATDVAARGLDIQSLPVVVNFDLPLVANDYIHRIGRTGRAGIEGQAVSFVSHDQLGLFRSIQRMLDLPVETGPLEGFDPGTTLDLGRVASQRSSGRAWSPPQNGTTPTKRYDGGAGRNGWKGGGRVGPDDRSERGSRARRDDRRPESDARSHRDDRLEGAARPRRDARSEGAARPRRDDRPERAPRPRRDDWSEGAARARRDDRSEGGSRPRCDARSEGAARPRRDDRSERAPRPRREDWSERAPRPRRDDRSEGASRPRHDGGRPEGAARPSRDEWVHQRAEPRRDDWTRREAPASRDDRPNRLVRDGQPRREGRILQDGPGRARVRKPGDSRRTLPTPGGAKRGGSKFVRQDAAGSKAARRDAAGSKFVRREPTDSKASKFVRQRDAAGSKASKFVRREATGSKVARPGAGPVSGRSAIRSPRAVELAERVGPRRTASEGKAPGKASGGGGGWSAPRSRRVDPALPERDWAVPTPE